MRFQIFVLTSIMLVHLYSCSFRNSTPFDEHLQLLEGEWEQSPGIGYRETWQRQGNQMIGAGYMHAGETFSQVEELSITIADSTLIYHAIVFDQNAGRQIDFHLADFSDSTLIFMNPDHDFPNSISYYFSGDSTLKIKVESLSDSTAGFELGLKKSRRPFKDSGI